MGFTENYEKHGERDDMPEVEDYGYRDIYINIYKFKGFLCHANSDGDFVDRVFRYIDDYIKMYHHNSL